MNHVAGGRLARRAMLVLGALTLVLCLGWFFLASQAPDGLEKTAEALGFAHKETARVNSPMAGYALPGLPSEAPGRALAGLAGGVICFVIAWSIGRLSRLKSE